MQPENKESKATPALVLSDECLLSKDLSKSLFGRVKQFAPLANIRKAVNNVSIGSWISQLKQASMDFNTEGRIAWVEVEEAPGWVPDFMEENDDEEQNDNGGFNIHESGSCGSDSDVEGMENMELFSVKMYWGNFAFDYVHSDSVDKQMMWDYLTYEIGKWKGEVVIMGDFNEVRYKSNRFGSVFIVQGANVFNSFITNAGLEEVPLGGSSFTWCHKSATNMSKLDIFLISENLLNTCPNITAITLERYLSDHRPILLRESHFDYGPTLFRFFHHWIEIEVFSKFMEECRGKAREWKKKNVLSTKNVKAKYKDELEALEAISDKGDGNVEVVNKRMEVVNTLQKIDKICSSKITQKEKGIMVDGMWIESPNRVKGEFFHHFSSRFDKLDARWAYIEMRYPKTLTCDQRVELESDVSNEEIRRANLIENDVYDAVKYFFTYGVIPKGCNSSFIALIVKIPNVNTVKDFRPISLIGSLYKIVAKILANRLAGVLGDIVNEVRSAFIAGRQILDGPFILNEVLQ
nr:RNA-directed DNA polymerase, eukaryota [Tanacetum cinerariifolium]